MKSKLMYGLAAALLAFGLVLGLSAFNKKSSTNLAYQYNGTNDSGVMTAGNWTAIPYEENPTECESIGDLPCVVQFDDTQFTDIADFLSNYVDADGVNNSVHTKRHKSP